MIRTNLIKRESSQIFRVRKWATHLLAVILAAQVLVLGVRQHDARVSKENFDRATQRQNILQNQVEKLKEPESLQNLAGKVAARNNWLFDRKSSPLSNLAKLQKNCPNNVKFLSYSADLISGKIVLTAPDLNSISSWLNGHFSNRGNISVVGKENNLLLIQFVWSG